MLIPHRRSAREGVPQVWSHGPLGAAVGLLLLLGAVAIVQAMRGVPLVHR